MHAETHMTWEGSRTAMVVLVVDDEKDLRSLLDFNLKQSGYRTLQAATGQEALMQAQRHAPDMILLDLNLPDTTGIEILRQVKENKYLKGTPVVILTTTDDSNEIKRCYELGCNVYITKPVNYESFANAIRQLGLFFSVIQVPPAAI